VISAYVVRDILADSPQNGGPFSIAPQTAAGVECCGSPGRAARVERALKNPRSAADFPRGVVSMSTPPAERRASMAHAQEKLGALRQPSADDRRGRDAPDADDTRPRPRPFAGKRVLVVDDNAINQRVARFLLEHLGVTVEVAGNGREAVRMVEQQAQPFDAILMDLQMPEMDGREAARAIRQLRPGLRLPIVAVTADDLQSEQVACAEAGMDDYLIKPLESARLASVLARHLTPGEAAPPAAQQPQSPEPAAPEPVATEQPGLPAGLESLPGIDARSALARLDGQHDLFVRLLRSFARQHEHSADEIRTAIDRNDLQVALAITHTLKGVAGTLSATAVYETARALEFSLRLGQRDMLGPHVERLGGVMEVVCQAIARWEQAALPNPDSAPDTTTAAARGATPAGLAEILSGFDRLLKAHRFSARKEFELVRDAVTGAEYRERLAAIQACLERLDFRQARELLSGIAKNLGISLS
jgi:CheY-like chemotaxis protein/HPt (histidine-containing phosphotransfer) domain-containing protein